MYQDYSGDAGSGIDEKLFVSVDKASHEARDSADECVTELNECGDDEYGPYKVKSKKMGNNLFAFEIIDKSGVPVEGYCVVEFEVDL
jgi:hypothetical protein